MKILINNKDLGKIATIDTYGTFRGDSVDESLIDYYNEEHDTDYGYDNFEWTYDNEAIVKDLAEQSRGWLLENVVGKVVKGIGKITGTFSPAYYNFTTDSWEAEWKIDEVELAKYIDQHKEDYGVWYSDSSWESVIMSKDDDNPSKRECQIIAMLEFYLNREFDSEEYLEEMHEQAFDIYSEHTDMVCLEEDK